MIYIKVKSDTLQVKGRKEHVEEESERRRQWMRMNKAEEDGKNMYKRE